jgi:hypothetical protein
MTQPPAAASPRRRAALVAGALAVAVIVAGVLWATRSDHPAKRAAAPLPTVTTPTPPPSSTSPTPDAKPTVRAVPHEVVAAAAPTSFVYRSRSYRIKAHVCGMENARPLDPPGEQHHTVCWVRHDFGYAPGSSSHGTTYVLGHSWGQDPHEVLNKISAAAMRQVLPEKARNKVRLIGAVSTYPVSVLDGDTVTLSTSTGELRYSVRDAYAVAKADAANVPTLMNEHMRNRIVIITCGELDHVDYDYNIIVEAFLTSSTARRSTT